MMKQANRYSHEHELDIREGIEHWNRHNIHACPSCGMMTLKGMPGGRDAVCKNCGFKEPCCSD